MEQKIECMLGLAQSSLASAGLLMNGIGTAISQNLEPN